MPRYVVAIRRDAKEKAPEDWVERVGRLPGVEVIGSYRGRRAVVEMEPDSVELVRAELGPNFRVEKQIEHRTN